MSSRIRSNHTIQELDNECVHDWYRFVLAYPDHLVQDLIERFEIGAGHTVLDPFVGTGTTLIECKKRGIRSIGLDANPVAAFASKVKTTWDIDLEDLAARSRHLLDTIREQTGNGDAQNVILRTPPGQLTLWEPEGEANAPNLDVQDDGLVALLPKDALSEKPLKKILIARDIINTGPEDAITDLFRLALATVAVRDMSNLGFGPEVYVRRNKLDDASITLPLSRLLDRIRRDLALVQRLENGGRVTVACGDARRLADYIDEPVDFVITSPPYPNEKDYTRITRLELALLGFIANRSDLKALKQDMLRSHTRNIYQRDHDADTIRDVSEIEELAGSIEQARIERGATSGFERLYHRVVREYFGGMHRVFEQLHQVMLPGGRLALVVGDQKSYFQVPIRTAHLLGLVAGRLGFHEIETRIWRTRLATATREELEEHILILARD